MTMIVIICVVALLTLALNIGMGYYCFAEL